ncbi:DUF6587 family protein [Dokdonella immobilis]|uniref:Uncharacterized protein n=1 Tax=Dokdonella immobilis TaxID=578942 RepID=A0A1I4WMJ2_9GAMM|nr:DUF6587 family protein [Dokdonella immobilis]SFN14452.1 hypothetical protein SAMN05216289_105138 [Dokdonella immobilis]
MNAALMQDLIVTTIVTLSVGVAARRLLPAQFRRLQAGLAHALGQPRRGRLLRAIGHWLQPAEARNGGCGSGLGCGSCGGCGSSTPPGDAIPLVLRPRRAADSARH